MSRPRQAIKGAVLVRCLACGARNQPIEWDDALDAWKCASCGTALTKPETRQ